MKFVENGVIMTKGELQALSDCADKSMTNKLCRGDIHFNLTRRHAVATSGKILLQISGQGFVSEGCFSLTYDSVKSVVSLMKSKKDTVVIKKDGKCTVVSGASVTVPLSEYRYLEYDRVIESIRRCGDMSRQDPVGLAVSNLALAAKVAKLCGDEVLAITGLTTPLDPIYLENIEKTILLLVMPCKL